MVKALFLRTLPLMQRFVMMGMVELKNALLEEVTELYKPDAVSNFEIIRSEPSNEGVTLVWFSFYVRQKKRAYSALIDAKTQKITKMVQILT